MLSSLLSVLVLGAAIGGFAYWKIFQGPVSVGFLSERIKTEVAKNLGGLRIELDDAIVEHDGATGLALVRLTNVKLIDGDGAIVSEAPEAGLTIESAPLLSGLVVPKRFEIVSPRIGLTRLASGAFVLGNGTDASGAPASQADGKSDRLDHDAPPAAAPDGAPPLAEIIDLLAGRAGPGAPLASLTEIIISDAAVTLDDAITGARLAAPEVDVTLKRTTDGFVTVVGADVLNGEGRFRADATATYRKQTRDFAVSASLEGLVPAGIAGDAAGLQFLAGITVPLTATAEFLVAETGEVASASGSATLGAGRIALAGLLAEPLVVESGRLTIAYDPQTAGLTLSKAFARINESEASIEAKLAPARAADGSLTAYAINATLTDLSLAGAGREPVTIAEAVFSGSLDAALTSLEIGKLTISEAGAQIVARGNLARGDQSPGLELEGSVSNLSSALLKRLWPPLLAPNTRAWVTNNVKSGLVSRGSFKVAFAPNGIAEALKRGRLPEDAVDVSFDVANVDTSYFRDLPQIRNASGEGRLRSNSFELAWTGGKVTLPSGKAITVTRGSMKASDLLAVITPARFDIDLAGDVQAAFEYIGLPALNLMKKTSFDTSKLAGDATVNVDLAIPLQKDLPRERVKVALAGKLAGAVLKDASGEMDLTGGAIGFTMKDGVLSGEGPVKLNGITAALAFSRQDGGAMKSVIETELDDKERLKIGADINDFVRGPVKLKVTIPEDQDGARTYRVEADLSKAELRLDVISWSRPPGAKSSAVFDFVQMKGRAPQIKNLVLKSGEIALEGDIVLSKNGGINEARLPKVHLDSENRFAVNLRRTDDEMTVSIDGKSFDARPLIKQMFSSKTTAGAAAGGKGGLEFVIDANIDRVYTNRGEVITNVRGNLRTRGGSVLRADLQGQFLSGHPIALRIKPSPKGGRCLTVRGRDAGAALRSANLYSKVAGGQIDLAINFASGTGFVKAGKLELRQFEVRNEAALAQLDGRAKPKKSGPRAEGLAFRKIVLPFTTDAKFIRITEAYARGNELCAGARGIIRKSDVAMDITGDIVPACAINNIVGEIPIIELLFPNGVVGVTYALGGTMAKPSFQVNPLSALAPGFLRNLFEFEKSNSGKRSAVDQTLNECNG